MSKSLHSSERNNIKNGNHEVSELNIRENNVNLVERIMSPSVFVEQSTAIYFQPEGDFEANRNAGSRKWKRGDMVMDPSRYADTFSIHCKRSTKIVEISMCREFLLKMKMYEWKCSNLFFADLLANSIIKFPKERGFFFIVVSIFIRRLSPKLDQNDLKIRERINRRSSIADK